VCRWRFMAVTSTDHSLSWLHAAFTGFHRVSLPGTLPFHFPPPWLSSSKFPLPLTPGKTVQQLIPNTLSMVVPEPAAGQVPSASTRAPAQCPTSPVGPTPGQGTPRGTRGQAATPVPPCHKHSTYQLTPSGVMRRRHREATKHRELWPGNLWLFPA